MPVSETSQEQTEITRRRYDRIAPIYDVMEWPLEFRFRRWRENLWKLVGNTDTVLELGVGTGKKHRLLSCRSRHNRHRYFRANGDACQTASRTQGAAVRLQVADAQNLPFPAASFDTVVTTFVFCSVPDLALGLLEAKRVLRPGGRLLMVEHVLSQRPMLRSVMRALDPMTHRIWGAHIDRETAQNVIQAGFAQVAATDLALDVVKQIEAAAPVSSEPAA